MDPPGAATASAASAATSGNVKTYVFVDEYNRHKRLKVMRACDGCRKRKIRCDGALQNGPWPCGACVRLKLKCLPPTLDPEDEQSTFDGPAGSGHFHMHDPPPSNANQPSEPPAEPTAPADWQYGVPPSAVPRTQGPTSAPAFATTKDAAAFSSQMYGQQMGSHFDGSYSNDEYFGSSTTPPVRSQSNMTPTPGLFRTQTGVSIASGGDPDDLDASVREVSGHMGTLNIDIHSVPAYIANEKKILAETPALEEPDVQLPPSFSTDSTLRIPPDMMPLEERALDYFGYFFDYIHPYVPVLHRDKFYEQWRSSRETISPLILEGIFACVTHYLEEPGEVRRWLALASKHEGSFKDVPRLSTVQGLMILLKAREAVARRGYYYRSWMELKFTTNMAVDLGLHEHHLHHREGQTCPLSRPECMIRTRVWQALLLLEVFVGGSQGRQDYVVDLDTVDFGLPSPDPELGDFEYQTSRRATYFAQVVGNAKRSLDTSIIIRRASKDWTALDPIFTRYNTSLQDWVSKLPPDMQIQSTTLDGPMLLRGKHFIAYMHIYHQLLLIMHHRPQFIALLEKRDPNFQNLLNVCNGAAEVICRLQEALHRDFGLHGLQFMQRGLGFTIYSILMCMMLHLATITAPDAATNARARTYFTRHMRILEYCLPNARPEVQPQINALREAFSQDTTKPFELKAGLGQRSPSQELQALPTFGQVESKSAPIERPDAWVNVPEANSSRTLSNASQYTQPFEDIPAAPQQPAMPFTTSSFNVPAMSTYTPINMHQPSATPQQTGYALEPVISNDRSQQIWDPSGIFSQWNAAFEQPLPTATQSPSTVPTGRMSTSPSAMMPQQQPAPMHQAMYSSQPVTPETGIPTVTPVMWQDVFTSAYVSGHGRKRPREESVDMSMYNQYHDRRG